MTTLSRRRLDAWRTIGRPFRARRLAVAIAATAVAMLATGAAADPRLPNGRYPLGDFSPVTFNCQAVPDGTVVENNACFGLYDAMFSGVYLSDYTEDGWFIGYWVQRLSGFDCGETIAGSRYWGRVKFRFSDDLQSWTGFRGDCMDEPTQRWDGWR